MNRKRQGFHILHVYSLWQDLSHHTIIFDLVTLTLNFESHTNCCYLNFVAFRRNCCLLTTLVYFSSEITEGISMKLDRNKHPMSSSHVG